jgi:hypothetical protein
LNVFSQEKKKEEQNIVDVSPLISEVGGSDYFISMYRKQGDETAGVKPLFYLCKRTVEKSSSYIVVALDEIPEGSSAPNCSFMTEMWPHFWKVMALVMSGSVGENPQIKFASKDTAEKIFKAVSSKSGG